MATMPAQKPGRSKQDYGTPPEFLAAVKAMLGIFEFDADLAASVENAKARFFYTEAEDSLVQPWNFDDGWNWLNPPFAHIEPWVQRAYEQTAQGAQTAVLIPAGVGANWWAKWVHDKALVLLLNGRLSFDGKAPYPKDCALLLYSPHLGNGNLYGPGYHVWNWRIVPLKTGAA